jgi:hypothetical protein
MPRSADSRATPRSSVSGRSLSMPFQEGAVDLHLLQREIVQVAEARIAGAEIVERDPHAERMQLRQHVVRQLGVAQQRGFGDLDLEPVAGRPETSSA